MSTKTINGILYVQNPDYSYPVWEPAHLFALETATALTTATTGNDQGVTDDEPEANVVWR